MRNMWNLFVSDVRHLFRNVLSTIIALGLVLLPSVFTWYNVLACWDVFENTGNLKVAVANVDDGYKSDLVPIEINVGESVTSALRANEQIDWVFTTQEDAVDGAASGRYYAAVVIPNSFSKDMLTFYSDDAEHASIIYYSNEKKNAVSPKITAQGADTVSYTVNQVFAKTLAEVSVSVAQGLSNSMEQGDANGTIASMSANVRRMASRTDQAAQILTIYGSLLGSTQAVADSSSAMVDSAGQNAQQLSEAGKEALVGAISHAESALRSFDEAYKNSVSADDILKTIDVSSGSADASTATEVTADVSAQAKELRQQADDISKQLDKRMSEEERQSLIPMRDGLIAMVDSLEQGSKKFENIKSLDGSVAEARLALLQMQATYDSQIKPVMEQLTTQMQTLMDQVEGMSGNLADASSTLRAAIDDVSAKIGQARSKIDDTGSSLTNASTKLSGLADEIDGALVSDDITMLKDILANDSDTLATALSAPVTMERKAVFEVENFGSAMTPLYATLALFVGALLLVVSIKPTVSRRALDDLGPDANVKPRHLFLGRFGIFGLLAFGQSTVLALGNMFFLGVQVAHPFLFLLCYWIVAQVFAFMAYTLVVSFANLGKAIMVLMLIVQVTACGGSFPLQILPEFVQTLSPWMPATHVVNAMRAAMFGTFGNDFWIEIGILLLFLIPFLLLGLVLRKPMARFMHWYIEQVEASDLMA